MRLLPSRLLCICVLLVLTIPAAVAQDTAPPSYPTPESVATAMYEAYGASDFERAATLMHPDALADLQNMLVAVAKDEPGMGQVFTGVESAEALAALSPEEVYTRFIGSILKIQPDMADILGTMEAEVVGHVAEGDSLAHVLSRSTMSTSGATVTQMQVVTVRQYDDGWRALLSGDISSFAQMIRAQAEQPEEQPEE